MDGFLGQLQHALSYAFIQRALIAGCLIGVSCACLGVFLVLRRMALIGDGIAHVSFAAVALALFLHAAPMLIAIPVVVAAALLILELGERNTYSDAAIGLVSSCAIAIGVLLASLGRGFNVDLFSYLFGNILAVSSAEVWIAGILSLGVLTSVIVFYHDFFAVTFDEEFSRASGVASARVKRILVALTAVTVVLGLKLVGTLLVSSLIVLPAVTALQIGRGFRAVIVIAVVCAVTAVFFGIMASYVLNLPAGAAIILFNFIFFLLASITPLKHRV